MKGICPVCEKETTLELINKNKIIEIRGENIEVGLTLQKCLECSSEFEDPMNVNDPLEIAYREYRTRKKMLQPEEIIEFRKKYGLSQFDLTAILGWGGVTLSRYENGALQTSSQDRELQLLMVPNNLKKMIITNSDLFNIKKREKLIQIIESEERTVDNLEVWYEENYANYEPSEYCGFIRLNFEKLINAILYFCEEDITKTKLNKLLYFLDFKHYKEYMVSVTGLRYLHHQFGPVPEHYDILFSILCDKGYLNCEEKLFGDYIGDLFSSLKKVDLNVFKNSELKVLTEIKEIFKDKNAKETADISHDDHIYKSTKMYQLITYNLAEKLAI